jgi:hypothetical protein
MAVFDEPMLGQSALDRSHRAGISAENNQPERHDLNHGEPWENATTAFWRRFFSSFEDELGLCRENQVNGR